MKKLFLFAICSLFFASSVNAIESYYYYRGKRIPITIKDDSVNTYYRNSTHKNIEQRSYTSKVIAHTLKDSISKDSISSIEYIVQSVSGTSTKISNRFYIQLYDSSNLQELHTMAKKTNTVVHRPIPNMPNWYELIVDHSQINNSLEMSNYFYETGLFKDVDPGFIINYRSSCVSDSHYSLQWGLHRINACDTWTKTQGKANVKIAIIDQGVYRQHPEFSSTQFEDYYDCYLDDSTTYSVYDGHGTFINGIIASNQNNNRIAGIAPNCKIMPISHPLYISETTSAELASGFAWAVSHNADIINCSWGDQGGALYNDLHSSVLESSIQNALTNGRNGKGCIVVFSSGNYNISQLDYPAYVFSDIITVGASNTSDHRASFSSYGNMLDVVAPGDSIYSTWLEGEYIYSAGTSFSAPHVAATAGLILSVNPYLTQKEVADIIESTAQKVGGYSYTSHSNRPNGKWNNEMGYGLVDAYAAVKEAQSRYIAGPNYVCDTTMYCLIHPSEPDETVSWSVHNGQWASPHYSIVGENGHDTVYVRCERMSALPNDPLHPDALNVGGLPLDTIQSLSVTISDGTSSETYKKIFRSPIGQTPEISASNSAFLWLSGTSRTFTITNCTSTPDSALEWEVMKIIDYYGVSRDTIITTSTGRTLTYTASAPTRCICSIRITATNTQMECEPQSVTKSYAVTRKISLAAVENGDILDISIYEDSDEQTTYQLAEVSAEDNYSLELQHSIYGRIRQQKVRSASEQINTTGLPQGGYLLLLKDSNGEIVAQAKMIIR